MKKYTRKKTAFVSIFAIFFSAIVISVLTAIYVLLIKQIQMMEIDSQSFQSLYVADSAFECMVYKEQNASGTASIFLPPNSGNLGNCTGATDLVWVSPPTAQSPVGQSVRSKASINLPIMTNDGDYCAVMSVDVETADSSQWVNPPNPNFMTIAGHNKACGSPSQKVVERVVDFYF
jgi:hypothetical protein